VATVTESVTLPPEILEYLELLMFGAIGMTSVALSAAEASDLTLPQWRALVVIGKADGVRVGDAAARIGISLPSASRLIRRLERRGYVSTERDESDRRGTIVRLTKQGAEVRAEVIGRRRQLMQEALARQPGKLPKELSRGLRTIAQAFARYE
jgi:DNA-binding MarR family transcriptional regulator